MQIKKLAIISSLLAATLLSAQSAAAYDEDSREDDGYVCAQVMPQCDSSGHVTGAFADRTSACYYFYDNLCLEQKVQELLAAQASCEDSEAQARKLKSRIRRDCRRR